MSITAKLGAFFCDLAGVKHGDSFWVALEERDHKEVMEAIIQRARVLEPGQVLVVPVSVRAAQSVARLQKQVEEEFKIGMLWAPVGNASGGLAVVKRQDLPPVEVEPEPVKIKPEPNTPDGLVKKLKTQVRELNKLGRNATSLAPIVHVRMPDEPLRQSPGPSMDASFAFRRIEIINNNHPGAVCSSSRVKVLVYGVPVGPYRSMTINIHRPAVTMVVGRYATTPKDDGR